MNISAQVYLGISRPPRHWILIPWLALFPSLHTFNMSGEIRKEDGKNPGRSDFIELVAKAWPKLQTIGYHDHQVYLRPPCHWIVDIRFPTPALMWQEFNDSIEDDSCNRIYKYILVITIIQVSKGNCTRTKEDLCTMLYLSDLSLLKMRSCAKFRREIPWIVL